MLYVDLYEYEIVFKRTVIDPYHADIDLTQNWLKTTFTWIDAPVVQSSSGRKELLQQLWGPKEGYGVVLVLICRILPQMLMDQPLEWEEFPSTGVRIHNWIKAFAICVLQPPPVVAEERLQVVVSPEDQSCCIFWVWTWIKDLEVHETYAKLWIFSKQAHTHTKQLDIRQEVHRTFTINLTLAYKNKPI